MRKEKKLLTIISAFLVSLFAFLPSFAHAEIQQSGIQISPLTYNFEIQQNQTRTGNLYIRNLDTTEMDYAIETELFRETDEYGAPSFQGIKKTEGVTDLTDWIVFNKPTEGTIKSGDQIDVTFEIKVPENAEPGGHYAAIFARQIKKDSEGKTQLGIASRVGLLILVSVPGDVTKTAEIDSFSHKHFAWSGPVNFDLKVKNTGTVHYQSATEVKITPLIGSNSTVSLGSHTILPNTIRAYSGQWSNKYPFGYYKIEAKATDGNGNIVTKNSSMWALPLIILLPILILILIIWLIVKHIKKNYKLVKVEKQK